MIRVVLVLAVLLTAAAPRLAAACAGCSNPNLPANRGQVSAVGAGELSSVVTMTTTYMNVVHSEFCPDIGPICDQRDEPGQLHDLDFYVGELRPIVELGISESVGVELQLPIRITRTSVVFRRLDGMAFEPDYDNIHHRTETLVGLGDPWLLGRFGLALGAWQLAARGGVALPVGSTEPDPFAAGRDGLEHQHIQFGTGTFSPIAALDLSRRFGRYEAAGYLQTQLFLYDNEYGYRAGNRTIGGLSGSAGLGDEARLGVAVDVLDERPERWQGEVQQDGNVGRTDVLVGATLSYDLGRVTATASLKAPVWQHFTEVDHEHEGEPSQLTYPAILTVGAVSRFDVW